MFSANSLIFQIKKILYFTVWMADLHLYSIKKAAMKLLIQPTKITPFIYFNEGESCLTFKGRSSPENPIDFYQSVIDFVDEFETSQKSVLVVNVCLEYFNTSSTKVLFNIFKQLASVQDKSGKVIVINWFYEDWDEDMLEIGEDFANALDLEFNLRELEALDEYEIEMDAADAA